MATDTRIAVLGAGTIAGPVSVETVTDLGLVQVKLPPDAELWSAELDGVPLKPQREGDCVLIDVPAGTVTCSRPAIRIGISRVASEEIWRFTAGSRAPSSSR